MLVQQRSLFDPQAVSPGPPAAQLAPAHAPALQLPPAHATGACQVPVESQACTLVALEHLEALGTHATQELRAPTPANPSTHTGVVDPHATGESNVPVLELQYWMLLFTQRA
jgi:hypothetical protein